MRNFIEILKESDDLEYDPLRFFWFHPETGMKAFGDQDFDHATYAYEKLHDHEDDFASDEGEFTDDESYRWNSHQISKAIGQGWVRGRYTKKGFIRDLNELSLQGQRRNVQTVAKWFMDHHPVDVLYVDFAEGDENSFWTLHEKNGLRGSRLEYFLSKGRVPSEMMAETIDPSHWPKPFAIVTFDEDDDMAHVYRNPPAGLLRRIIGLHDCRAMIDHTGALFAWPEFNCYHDDVRKGLNVGKKASLMLCAPEASHPYARVSVKGFTQDPVPCEDAELVAILRANRGLRDLFGEDFPVDTYDWN